MAKLKAVFDRFDLDKVGKLNGEQVEQLLLYMDRSVENEETRGWINRLKAGDKEIDFPEFVAEYSVGNQA
ncbi:EF-hand domain-containing protein [archaeon]|nr:MAG: EF-hand domain-containing protein [archaeon]